MRSTLIHMLAAAATATTTPTSHLRRITQTLNYKFARILFLLLRPFCWCCCISCKANNLYTTCCWFLVSRWFVYVCRIFGESIASVHYNILSRIISVRAFDAVVYKSRTLHATWILRSFNVFTIRYVMCVNIMCELYSMIVEAKLENIVLLASCYIRKPQYYLTRSDIYVNSFEL